MIMFLLALPLVGAGALAALRGRVASAVHGAVAAITLAVGLGVAATTVAVAPIWALGTVAEASGLPVGAPFAVA